MEKTQANFQPLTPIHFLERAASVYPDHLAVVHGDVRYDYAELYRRCRRLASALRGRGIGRGDTVSILAPNIPAILESHYGVPMASATLNTINPSVQDAAVVARPDEKWGETPCAFITLKPGAFDVHPDEIIEFCRERLAHFKAPKTVVFGELPKTSTGKVQKYVLRDRARDL